MQRGDLTETPIQRLQRELTEFRAMRERLMRSIADEMESGGRDVIALADLMIEVSSGARVDA